MKHGGHNLITPTRVADMAALDASIEAYLARRPLSERTLRVYDFWWSRWEAWCTENDLSVAEADGDTVVRWLAVMRTGERTDRWGHERSGPVREGSLGQALAAVRYHYEGMDLIAPQRRTDPPGIRAKHAIKNYLRWLKTNDFTPTQAVPWTPEDVLKLMESLAALKWTLKPAVTRCVVLLMSLHELSADDLATIEFGDVQVDGDMTRMVVNSDALTFECEHSGPVSATCVRCAVNLVRELHPTEDGSHQFLATTPKNAAEKPSQTRSKLGYRARDCASAWTGYDYDTDRRTLRPRSGASDEELRGSLLGMTSGGATLGIVALRQGAMLRLGFARGFRADDVFQRLGRDDVTWVKNGAELTIFRDKSNDERSRTIAVQAAANPRLCPVAALRDWLSVRDAAIGAEVGAGQPLFCAGTQTGLDPSRRLAHASMSSTLKYLLEAVGWEGGQTNHSMRTGFAVTAGVQGKDIEEIQHTMRLKKPETAARYIGARGQVGARAVGKLVGGGDE